MIKVNARATFSQEGPFQLTAMSAGSFSRMMF